MPSQNDPLLAAVAAITQKVELGTPVTPPFLPKPGGAREAGGDASASTGGTSA